MQDHEFRDLMADVCALVTVVTTEDDDGPHGATVTSFASLSATPLVTVALDRRSALLSRILSSRRFGVNVLASADDEMALSFARPRGTSGRCPGAPREGCRASTMRPGGRSATCGRSSKVVITCCS
ncbi:Flavin reductase like domain-containing protein [Prauserella aidingensis]|nr:flavin reductase family protein [Prauserella aidingensis]MCP2256001.1 Flavin reductase like domain-containing protein [Prauserella aidingensis]